jgi:predicted permease
MSLPLLIAAGLFLRSLQRADSIGAGFDPEGVYMTTLDLSMEGYTTPVEGMLAFDRILERVRAIPGALYAAVSDDLPLDLGSSATMSIPEGRDLEDPASRMRVPHNQVTDEYFATLGIPLLAGRAFDSRDTPESTGVAVVSREFARVAWPDGEVLGRRFLHGGSRGTWLTIVGVVEDVKSQLVTDPAESSIYRPRAQNYSPTGVLTVRFADGVEGIAEPLRRSILEVDPRLSMTPVFSVAEYTSVGILPQRMAASLASGLGLVALLLSGIGIYGVVAFSVLQRTREIGVRMALGADRGRVLREVVRDAFDLALPGLVLGVVAAVILGRLLEAFLLGVSPLDLTAFTAVGCALLGVVLVASFVPARRAARVDPSEALRY